MLLGACSDKGEGDVHTYIHTYIPILLIVVIFVLNDCILLFFSQFTRCLCCHGIIEIESIDRKIQSHHLFRHWQLLLIEAKPRKSSSVLPAGPET